METRAERFQKWLTYSLLSLLFLGIQGLFFAPTPFSGLTPTLIPLLPAMVGVCEPDAQGLAWGVCYGTLCDLALCGPFPCFYLLLSLLIVLTAGGLCVRLLNRGILCSLAACASALLISALLHIAVLLSRGAEALPLLRYGATEFLLSLPIVFILHYPFMLLHRQIHLYD